MPGVEWQAAAAAAAVGEDDNECLHRDCFHVKEYGGGAAAAAMGEWRRRERQGLYSQY